MISMPVALGIMNPISLSMLIEQQRFWPRGKGSEPRRGQVNHIDKLCSFIEAEAAQIVQIQKQLSTGFRNSGIYTTHHA